MICTALHHHLIFLIFNFLKKLAFHHDHTMKVSSCCLMATLLIIVSILIQHTNALTYTLDPAEERCLFETLDKPSKLSLKYQVIKGGFLDIDLV